LCYNEFVMMQTPEKEKPEGLPEGVEEVHTEPEMEVVGEIAKSGLMQPSQSQFKAQVTDDSGQPLIQTPQTTVTTIKVPATQTQLDDWSKGPIEKALTWFAVFWIRMVKKAFHFGWRIVSGKNDPNRFE